MPSVSPTPVPPSLLQVEHEVAQLRTAAASGSLTIDAQTGQDLRKSLLAQADKVNTWLTTASGMSTALPMGQNWVGQAMATKFAGRADGGDASLAAVLRQYHSMLLEAADAVGQSVNNYQQAEHNISTTMRGITRNT